MVHDAARTDLATDGSKVAKENVLEHMDSILPRLPVESEVPTRRAYTCAVVSSQASPSASEPRRLASSIVVALSSTVSARWGPRPNFSVSWVVIISVDNGQKFGNTYLSE